MSRQPLQRGGELGGETHYFNEDELRGKLVQYFQDVMQQDQTAFPWMGKRMKDIVTLSGEVAKDIKRKRAILLEKGLQFLQSLRERRSPNEKSIRPDFLPNVTSEASFLASSLEQALKDFNLVEKQEERRKEASPMSKVDANDVW